MFPDPIFQCVFQHHGWKIKVDSISSSEDPTSIMWPISEDRTCMPKNDTSGKPCTLGRYPSYAVSVSNVAQIQLAINFARTANLASLSRIPCTATWVNQTALVR